MKRSFFKNGTPKPDPADNGCHGAPKVHRGCGTCAHPERARIEALYVAGDSLDKLAAQFPPLKRDAIFRHCRSHLSDATKISYLAGPAAIADLANLAARENRGVIEYLAIIRSILMHAMNTEAAKGNHMPSSAPLAGCLRRWPLSARSRAK